MESLKTSHKDRGTCELEALPSKSQITLHDPYSRLPSEIVAEIFVKCLPSSKFVAPHPNHAPMLLSQVSALWRVTCLSTPRLWSSLSIDIRRRSQNVGVGSTEHMMATWLSRAGNCSLSISMASDAYIDQGLWDVFFNFSSQWRHIRINSPAPAELPHQLSIPQLETFELMCLDHSMEYAHQLSRMLNWSSASSLRKFYWHNFGYTYRRLGLEWSRLIHLTLNVRMSVEDCLDILGKSETLTHVAFQSVIVQSLPSSRDQILLPRLRSLGLRASENIASLLDALVLPGILEFVFNAMGSQEEPWPQTSFLNLIDRSNCALKSLSFYYLPLTTEDLLDCLRRTQGSLKVLTLQTCGEALITDEVLDVLTVKDGLCLCPKLQVLALYHCISCTPGRVADMVRSRLDTTPMPSTDPRAIARMEVVEMYDSETELEPLKDFKKQGVILKVYSATGDSLAVSPEDHHRLQELEKDGLVLQIYDSSTGQFWDVKEE